MICINIVQNIHFLIIYQYYRLKAILALYGPNPVERERKGKKNHSVDWKEKMGKRAAQLNQV